MKNFVALALLQTAAASSLKFQVGGDTLKLDYNNECAGNRNVCDLATKADITDEIQSLKDDISDIKSVLNANGLSMETNHGHSIATNTGGIAANVDGLLRGEQMINQIQLTPGPKGDQGPQGIQGIKGETGLTGSSGAKGEQGIQGEAGIQGETGPAEPAVSPELAALGLGTCTLGAKQTYTTHDAAALTWTKWGDGDANFQSGKIDHLSCPTAHCWLGGSQCGILQRQNNGDVSASGGNNVQLEYTWDVNIPANQDFDIEFDMEMQLGTGHHTIMGMGVALEDERGQWIAMAGAKDGGTENYLSSFSQVLQNPSPSGGGCKYEDSGGGYQIGSGTNTYYLKRAGGKVDAGVTDGDRYEDIASSTDGDSSIHGAIKRIALIPARNYEDANFGEVTVSAIRTCLHDENSPTLPENSPTAEPKPPMPQPSVSQDNRCHSCHYNCGFEKAYDGDLTECGRCSLYGSPSSPGPVTITYTYPSQVQASKWPVRVDYGGNGYYGTAQVAVKVDGVQVHSQNVARKTSYQMDPYELIVNQDFQTIQFVLSGGTSGTGPNPSMSVCEISYV